MEYIGILMVVAFFLAIFTSMAMTFGWKVTTLLWGVSLFLTAWVVIGIKLACGGE